MNEPLPVDEILPDLLRSVCDNNICIVQAPPGSGKTTRIAPYLVKHLATCKLEQGRTLLLQPRRIAVQSVAARIAAENDWSIGHQVGYAIRFDTKYSDETKLLVATEGILRRRFSQDITLPGVQVVIFDEFHERSLDSDLLLMLCRHLQATLRPDLRIVVMSATIATDELIDRFPKAAVHQTEGRTYPVKVLYHPINPRDRLTDEVAREVVQASQRQEGDILVFLPGKGEIFQVLNRLGTTSIDPAIEILPLYGAMPLEEQAAAICRSVRRRIILSTNIAETSLTIEGVRVVIDSGQARVLRFDPASGLDRLVLEPISRASADQRAGRAGRVAAGTAIRLWSPASQAARSAYLEPEIHRVDFSGAMLQLYQLNETRIADLPWLDEPRVEAVDAAKLLLERLKAVDKNGITRQGEMISRLPLHPRLGQLLLSAADHGILKDAALAAALISERDPFLRRSSQSHGSRQLKKAADPSRHSNTSTQRRWLCDISEQITAIREYHVTGQFNNAFGEIHRNSLQVILRVADQIEQETSQLRFQKNFSSSQQSDPEGAHLRRAFLAAYPDRVAKRRDRGKDKALMVGGKGVRLTNDSGVVEADYFVCLDVDAGTVDASVRKASTIDREWLSGENIDVRDELFYSPTHSAVHARRRTYWLDLCIDEIPVPISDKSAASKILFREASRDLQRFIPKDNLDLRNLIGKLKLLASRVPEAGFPAIDDDFMKQVLENICHTVTSLQQIQSANWPQQIRERLTAEQAELVRRWTPSRIALPNGRELSVDYTHEQPFIAIKIQDAFGMKSNPRICDGHLIVQMHLLAPNQRPQQITNDLASFWANGYPIVKKELKRRYSKHAWPDDPTVFLNRD